MPTGRASASGRRRSGFFARYAIQINGYIQFHLGNEGNNPVDIWKHITSVGSINNGRSEPECARAGGVYATTTPGDPLAATCTDPTDSTTVTSLDDLEEWMDFDLSVQNGSFGLIPFTTPAGATINNKTQLSDGFTNCHKVHF